MTWPHTHAVGLALSALVLLGAKSKPSENFTVQVASTSARAEAERLVTTLVGRDLPAYWSETSVGGKTMYRVRVGSFPSKDAARSYADGLPKDLELEYWVAPIARFALDGAPPRAPDEDAAGSKLTTAKAAPSGTPQSAIEAVDETAESGAVVLGRAMTAHGGADGGFIALDHALSVVLRYRLKSLDPKTGEPVFTRHVYYRKGKTDLRLEISPMEGEGHSSTTIAATAAAWVDSGGKRTALAAPAARSRIEALGPAGMLRLPLAFPNRGAMAAGIAGETIVAGSRTLNGEPVIRLDAAKPPSPYREASLYLDPLSDRLVASRFLTDAGELLLTFSDYREVGPGLIVPFRRQVYRDGTVVSSVEIDDLRLNADLDASLFAK